MTLRLDIINSMLATTGTARLAAEDAAHPNYVKANDILNDVLEEFSSRELWFNTAIRTLTPETVGSKILVPSDALSADPTDGSLNYAIRGQYLFDFDNYTNVIACPVEVKIVMEVPLDDMPPIAVQFLRAHARFQYYLDQDGSGTKLQVYSSMFEAKELQLITVNMKHKDVNFFGGTAYANFQTRRDVHSNPNTRIQ